LAWLYTGCSVARIAASRGRFFSGSKMELAGATRPPTEHRTWPGRPRKRVGANVASGKDGGLG